MSFFNAIFLFLTKSNNLDFCQKLQQKKRYFAYVIWDRLGTSVSVLSRSMKDSYIPYKINDYLPWTTFISVICQKTDLNKFIDFYCDIQTKELKTYLLLFAKKNKS
jgi:hypothetical protein